MTWFADLSPNHYFGPDAAPYLTSVGWLARDKEYNRGPVDSAVYQKLKALLDDSWPNLRFRGFHQCELCRPHDEARCNNNLFVPDGHRIFVCPAMILHYMDAHEYNPPDEFRSAVLACPHTRSTDYRRLLLASGGHLLIQSGDRWSSVFQD